ncbi:MAG: GIY-YIG nuclease family protein [Acidimicrobiia bacterium]|nr:GIY-YIG nuclease family protein [Acidimicrobiia bacterium]MYB75048.1 GIY-YIG nuclease family protein [Acidimicrobiia bacterium]MYH99971.1 GIY-YIG nuclease family protein [Acidimicrobiia bacterium]
MTNLDTPDNGPSAMESSRPATWAGSQAQDEQRANHPSRAELRNRALESRNSYELGELPGEEEGAEIDDALRREAEEESSLGDAFRFLVLDEIPDDERISALREHFGHTGSGTANGLRQHLDALRFGIFPQGPSMARNIAGRMKSIMRRHDFSEGTRAVLERNIAELEKIAADTDAFEAEQQKAEVAEQSVEDSLKSRSGVYVFTYPHYLRHPTHQSSESEKMPDRTLLKVGFSDSGILERVNQETRGAGVPEHRRVLRAYLTTGAEIPSNKVIEQQFHDLLDSAGHAGPKRGSTEHQRGGNEWFYTSVEFLDAIAGALGLEIIEIDAPDL